MSLSFGVLLEGVRYGDGSVAEVLTIHSLNGSIGCIKAGKINESIAFGVASVWVSHDFWCLEDDAKGTECVVEQFLVYFRVEITDENVGTHIKVFVVCRCFIYSNWFAIEFYHIHNFDGIVGILFTEELYEAVTLMLSSHPVFGHVCVDHRTCLQKELP